MIQNSFSELHMCVYVLEGADEALGTLVSPLLRHISPLRPGVEA